MGDIASPCLPAITSPPTLFPSAKLNVRQSSESHKPVTLLTHTDLTITSNGIPMEEYIDELLEESLSHEVDEDIDDQSLEL